MLSAIDVPKSKSTSIAFMALKSMLMGLFLCLSFSQRASESDSTQCSDNLVQSVLVYKLFFFLGALLDLFLLCYFLCTAYFNRMEYYILFTFHMIFAGFAVIVALVQSFAGGDCDIKNSFLGTCFALTVVFAISAIIVMYFNLYFSLKFANLGCNIVWTAFWIQSSYCGSIFIAAIGFIHGVLSALGLLSFIVMSVLRKSTTTAKFWKQIYVVSIALMVFCFVIALIATSSSRSCGSEEMFVLTYQKFGAIEIVSPVLLLIFLHTEMGDPRQTIVKTEANIFGRNRENENFKIDDIN